MANRHCAAGFNKPAGADAGWTKPALRAPHRLRTKGDTPSRRSLLNKVLNIAGELDAGGAAVTGAVATMLGEAAGVGAAATVAVGATGAAG